MDVDNDGDGIYENEGDCDDTNVDIFPDAEDYWYDGIDSNCDGSNDYDWDGDGISILEGDCNDYDLEIGTTVYRLASEYIEEDRESDGEFEFILERFYDYDDSGQLSLLTVNPIIDTSNTLTPRGERYYEWDDFHRLLLDKHIYTYEPVGDFDRITQEEKPIIKMVLLLLGKKVATGEVQHLLKILKKDFTMKIKSSTLKPKVNIWKMENMSGHG